MNKGYRLTQEIVKLLLACKKCKGRCPCVLCQAGLSGLTPRGDSLHEKLAK